MTPGDLARAKWRFWFKTDGWFDGCVVWTADNTRSQCRSVVYGRAKFMKRRYPAHKLIWELLNGPVPAGLVVRHRCDNGLCVNPGHLELGTVADNNRDRDERGRTMVGSRVSTSKLSETIVIQILARFAKGEKRYALAREFGVHFKTVEEIVRRRSWRHVPERDLLERGLNK